MEDAVMKKMRADQFLAHYGCGSRKDAKKLIREGRLLRNGIPVKAAEEKISPEADLLCFDGQELSFSEHEYWALNKPAGILSAISDSRHETVISYMGLTRRGLSPCGRLDLDTTGLLLITDDGALIHRLLSPAKHVDKVYEVSYEGVLPEDAASRFLEGVVLEDGTKCLPARLDCSSQPVRLTIREGKFHQVKRMFLSMGCPVTKLRRIAMGPLWLDRLQLSEGDFRKLTEEEVAVLQNFDREKEIEGSRPNCKRYQGFLFDLDGTLADSMHLWGDIDRRYLSRHGISCPEDLHRELAGKSFSEVAQYFKTRFSIPDSTEEMMAQWEQMALEAYRTEISLKPGAHAFLSRLKERGAGIALATSNRLQLAEHFLKAQGIYDLFDLILTSDCVKAGKPKPDIYLEAARRLALKPRDCLVFEDIPEGIQAGKRAGMTVCAVEDTASLPLFDEIKASADFMIRDFTELL